MPLGHFQMCANFEELIARPVFSGRYNNSSEVVRAGLRALEQRAGAFFIRRCGVHEPPRPR